MSTNNAKYLVLRGKNKDIYFIQKRLTKSQSLIIGKDFIKKSLETTSLEEAIAKRDKILSELDHMELNINVPENINMNDNIQNVNIEYTADTIENSNKDEKSENMENNMTISDIDISTNEDIMKTHTALVVTDATLPISQLVRMDAMCRSVGKSFLYAYTSGVNSSIFVENSLFMSFAFASSFLRATTAGS